MTRHAGASAFFLAAACLCAAPASGQPMGEAHVVAVRGGDSVFRFGGFGGGVGVFVGHRIGVDGDVALVVDDSAERDGLLMLSGGASLHFVTRQRGHSLAPFVSAGLTTVADGAAWYLGGGANYWIGRRAAIRLDLRGVGSATDPSCPINERTVCHSSRKAWFLRGGLAVGVGR